MKITPAHIILPIIAILVGMALIYAGLWGGWGIVWTASGSFFIAVGLGATLLTLAWTLPDPAGVFLRQPVISILPPQVICDHPSQSGLVGRGCFVGFRSFREGIECDKERSTQPTTFLPLTLWQRKVCSDVLPPICTSEFHEGKIHYRFQSRGQ